MCFCAFWWMGCHTTSEPYTSVASWRTGSTQWLLLNCLSELYFDTGTHFKSLDEMQSYALGITQSSTLMNVNDNYQLQTVQALHTAMKLCTYRSYRWYGTLKMTDFSYESWKSEYHTLSKHTPTQTPRLMSEIYHCSLPSYKRLSWSQLPNHHSTVNGLPWLDTYDDCCHSRHANKHHLYHKPPSCIIS